MTPQLGADVVVHKLGFVNRHDVRLSTDLA
jgi:hypothetical protein